MVDLGPRRINETWSCLSKIRGENYGKREFSWMKWWWGTWWYSMRMLRISLHFQRTNLEKGCVCMRMGGGHNFFSKAMTWHANREGLRWWLRAATSFEWVAVSDTSVNPVTNDSYLQIYWFIVIYRWWIWYKKNTTIITDTHLFIICLFIYSLVYLRLGLFHEINHPFGGSSIETPYVISICQDILAIWWEGDVFLYSWLTSEELEHGTESWSSFLRFLCWTWKSPWEL